MADVPDHIIAAVDALLAPYGERFAPSASRGYLTPAKAAKYLGVSRTTVFRMAKRGLIHIGGELRLIPLEELDAAARGDGR